MTTSAVGTASIIRRLESCCCMRRMCPFTSGRPSVSFISSSSSCRVIFSRRFQFQSWNGTSALASSTSPAPMVSSSPMISPKPSAAPTAASSWASCSSSSSKK